MSIQVTSGYIEPNSGDRVLIFNGKFLVRFQPKKLEPTDPWMTLISSDDEWARWLDTDPNSYVQYSPSPTEIEFGRQSLLNAYTSIVKQLGILI